MAKKIFILLIVILLSGCKADCFDDKAMTKLEFKSNIKAIKLTTDNWQDFLDYTIVEIPEEDDNGNLTGNSDGYLEFSLKDGYIVSENAEIAFNITTVSQEHTYDVNTDEEVSLMYGGDPYVYENEQTLYLSNFNYQTKMDEYPIRIGYFSDIKSDYTYTSYDNNNVEREVYPIYTEDFKSLKAIKASGTIYQLDLSDDKIGTKDGKNYFAIYDDKYVTYYYENGYVEVYDENGVYLYDNAYIDLDNRATNTSAIFYYCWGLDDIIN